MMKIGKTMKSIIAFLLVFALLTGCAGKEEPIEEKEPENQLVDNGELPEFDVTWGTFRYAGMFSGEEADSTAEYAYSDEYFDIDSTIYNPSLATMSLCFELSSWSSHDTDIWNQKSQNAKALLKEIGFKDFAQNEFWNDKPSTKSVGAVVANKTLGDCTLIALAVRGGGYYNEWGSNVAVGLSGEHTGFSEGKENVIRFLNEYIEQQEITGKVKIWLVGYSRGAAIANLVAGYLNQNGLGNGAELAVDDLYCYAFAPPKGATEEEIGEDFDHANIHNIINVNDVVPLVAPGNWGFNRYNTTSRLLPTITTAGYEEALEVMLEEYQEVLDTAVVNNPEETEYGISEYAKKIKIDINPLVFTALGEPLIEIEIVDDTRQTMAEMLGSFIYSFADHVHGRDNYYSLLESDLVSLLNDLMGYETEVDFEEAMNTFVSTLTEEHYENLKYVMEPILHISKGSEEETAEEVTKRLEEVLPQPEGYEDLYGTAASLIKIIGETVAEDTEELMDIVLAFADSKLMQAHYPEIMLAWMRAGDVNYTDRPFTMKVPEMVRVIRVNCPVNVEIYDSKNNLVASAIDRVCTTNNSVVGCAVNENGEIIIHLPSDEEYRVVTTATGDGEVNITVGEYNMARTEVTRVQNYPNIPVKTGDVLTLSVPKISEEEYSDEGTKGSAAEYELIGSDAENIPCTNESTGDDIAYFNVSAVSANEFGFVQGGGSYLVGSFAMLTAKPVAGSEFIGWYIGEEMVSDSAEYRFAVTEDITLEARFTEAKLHKLTFKVSGKGTVLNIDKEYTEGSRIQLSAVAEEGYVFAGWKTTSGEIEDPESENTTITVGNKNAVVTAVFKKAEGAVNCSNCGKELEDGKNHKASCGVSGHYTCDGKEHSAEICGEKPEENKTETEETVNRCQNCRQPLAAGENHAASCGKSGHYYCDGTDHSKCNSSSSTSVPESSGAEVPEFGGTFCGGCGAELVGSESHPNSCGTLGHCDYDGGDHGYASCGYHHNCDGQDHGQAPCGMPKHYNCDGMDHSWCNTSGSEPEIIVCKVCGETYYAGEDHTCP